MAVVVRFTRLQPRKSLSYQLQLQSNTETRTVTCVMAEAMDAQAGHTVARPYAQRFTARLGIQIDLSGRMYALGERVLCAKIVEKFMFNDNLVFIRKKIHYRIGWIKPTVDSDVEYRLTDRVLSYY
jgi:hypothetical protein